MGEVDTRFSAIGIANEIPLTASSQGNATGSELESELTSYLGTLGLGDNHLAKVVSLLQATHGEGSPQAIGEVSETESVEEEEAPVVARPRQRSAPATERDTVGLFLAEEQQILMHAYRSFFSAQPAVQLLGYPVETSSDALIDAVNTHQPDVMLLGVKALRTSTVEVLETLREACPKLAVVLLFAFYDAQGIKALREFSRDVSVGRAYLLKHTIDTVDQLTHAICSVAEGRMIVDPTVMEELIKTGDAQNEMLRDLSPRALEVLHWVARGYRNETIAGVLSRDVKTVERHINNIYTSLLSPDDQARHPRVKAALMYLRATGVLSTEQVIED